MSTRLHTTGYVSYDQLPSQLERYLVEIIPNLICERCYIKIDGNLVPEPETIALISTVRDALCFARLAGNAYLYVGADGKVNINSSFNLSGKTPEEVVYPDVIVSFNGDYQEFQTLSPSPLEDKYTFPTYRRGSPLVSADVCTAYSLFKNAQDRAYLRLKNGNGTLFTLIDGDDESEQITPEVIQALDKKYENQNRMYAPDGAKLTGISVSLDGIQAVLDAFWENIFRAAVIPPWAYEKQQLNSSFTLEHMFAEKKRLWFKEVYPVIMKIVKVYAPNSKISIAPPDFTTEKYRAEVNVLKADVRSRDAISGAKNKEVEVMDQEIKDMKAVAKMPPTLATPLVRPVTTKKPKNKEK
jgi:hypothetical protein